MRPVISITGNEADIRAVFSGEHAISVELDLVNPFKGFSGRLIDKGGKFRMQGKWQSRFNGFFQARREAKKQLKDANG